EKAGANLLEGGVNGTTNQDRTNYFATVPSGNLENLLWLESDRLATLTDALTKEKLDNQRDVVKNERRQGLENTPYGRWYKLVLENLHPAGHPYSWTVIGSHEDLTAASLDDVKDFFKEYYTPNDLSLVIAGDFDPAEAKRLVEKYFGGIPAGPPLARPRLWIPVLEGEKIVEAADRVPQDRVYMVWPSPPGFSPGDAELDLASLILAAEQDARVRPAALHGGSGVPGVERDLELVRGRGDGAPRRFAGRGREDGDGGDRAAGEDRPDAGGACAGENEVGGSLRHP